MAYRTLLIAATCGTFGLAAAAIADEPRPAKAPANPAGQSEVDRHSPRTLDPAMRNTSDARSGGESDRSAGDRKPQQSADQADRTTRAEKTIADWPQTPQKVARQMIEKYGAPDGITSSRLFWQDKQPWAEIIVYKEEVPHHFPMKHTDVLEQVVNYQVPVDKFDELAEYDGSVIVERTKGTLAARCDKEPANYLALNLAHDIVTGKKTVEEARQFYADTVKKLMKGEKPEYTQKLNFQPQPNAGDAGVAIIDMNE